MIRKSRQSDYSDIRRLIELCFGNREAFGAYDDLDGRYIMCFVDDQLVAMSGINDSSRFNASEIDWTCTHPDYRHKGYMQKLFKYMLADIKTDVYCSCWRIADSSRVNLQTLMDMYNFQEVVHEREHCIVPHNCHFKNKRDCAYFTTGHCECYEDLYLYRCAGPHS